MDFLLLNAAKEAMIAHARDDAPLECCGLLLGAQGVIEEAVRARNLRHSRTAYLVDPADHFAAIRRARKEGRTIVGAYHSHPRSPAVPSPVDLLEAQYPDFLYVIVSLADPRTPDVRGYRLIRDAFTAETLIG